MNYDVAISYVSQDLSYATELYEALYSSVISDNSDERFNVFFDRDAKAKDLSWGKDVRKNLSRIYNNSRCCVILLSENYFMSQWTKLELRSASNALPVVVGPLQDDRRKLHDIDWPGEGAAALVPRVRDKLEQLECEKTERRQQRHKLLKVGLTLTGFAATIIAANAAANQHTQARLEENTGSIDGHWVDSSGIAWQIVE